MTSNTVTESPTLSRVAVAIGLVALAVAICNQWWAVPIAIAAVIVAVLAGTRNPSTRPTATVGAVLGAIASGIIFFL